MGSMTPRTREQHRCDVVHSGREHGSSQDRVIYPGRNAVAWDGDRLECDHEGTGHESGELRPGICGA